MIDDESKFLECFCFDVECNFRRPSWNTATVSREILSARN